MTVGFPGVRVPKKGIVEKKCRATQTGFRYPPAGIDLVSAIGAAAGVLDSLGFFPTVRICSADTNHRNDAG